MNKMKNIRRLIPIIFLFFLVSCVSRVAIKSDYDFSKIKHVGVLRFTNYRHQESSGEAVADEFIRQLLRKNVNVVERINLENILKEQELSSSGYLNPETARKAKELLGIDVIITGTVTEYSPETKYVVVSSSQTRPIKIGSSIIESDQELNPQLFITNAKVGISARMIDVETGAVVWANAYTYDAMDIQTAIEWTVSDLLASLKKVWPPVKK